MTNSELAEAAACQPMLKRCKWVGTATCFFTSFSEGGGQKHPSNGPSCLLALKTQIESGTALRDGDWFPYLGPRALEPTAGSQMGSMPESTSLTAGEMVGKQLLHNHSYNR